MRNSNINTLIECRRSYADIQRLREDAAMMARGIELVPDSAALDSKLKQARDSLRIRRGERNDLMGCALQILDKVPRRERKTLVLYYVYGYTAKAIAQELHIDERTVYKNKRAGLEMLGGMDALAGGKANEG